MHIRKLAAVFVAALLISMTGMRPAAAETGPVTPPLRISEVQTGSTESGNHEFVELYNPGAGIVDLTGWRLEYKSATGAIWSIKATLSGQLGSRSFLTIASSGYPGETQAALTPGLAAAGGHIRLAFVSGESSHTADLVGWGTADSPEGSSAAAPPIAGGSIQRCFAGEVLVDTDSNAIDLLAYAEATPGTGIACPDPAGPEQPPQEPLCREVIITELLPNPAGADSGHEFIELYNPTGEPLDLAECQLRTSLDASGYSLTGLLDPGIFYALSDGVSGLTLANASGGTVYIVNTDDEIVHSVAYPADMPDDAAWAFIDGRWELTYNPTPGSGNSSLPVKPCPEDQIRSDETGRCRAISAATATEPTLTPCRAGQERNPATNRCRAIASTAPALTPCKPGQERNPETNRCRSVAGTATALKPCPAGQERSPDTNRCRKIATAATSHSVGVQDVAATSVRDTIGWWIAGLVITGAVAYALFEWRHEVKQALTRLRQKAFRQRPAPQKNTD